MAARKITLDALSAEDVAKLVAQLKAAEQAEQDAKKAQRDKGRTVGQEVVTHVLASLPTTVFSSGAHGVQIGGKDFEHEGRTYRLSVLIRDEQTIPA